MNAESGRVDRDDECQDRRAIGVGTSLVLVVMVVMGLLHSIALTRLLGTMVPDLVWIQGLGYAVMAALMPALVLGRGVTGAQGWWRALRAVLPAAALATSARSGTLALLGAWEGRASALWFAERAAEWLGGLILCVGAAMIGYFYLHSQRTLRMEERLSGQRATDRELALRTLETEEVRVRRSIAEGLHGSLQQRLVIQSIRIDIMVERATELGVEAEILDGLRALREEIDQIRENDVREMSRMLYPESIEIGMVPAIRALLRRLPPGIATSLEVSDAVRDIDDPACSLLSQAARLLAVRFVEEAVTNGLRHGHATAFTVSVDFVDGVLMIEATNNGSAMDLTTVEAGSGLRRLRERFQLVGGLVDIVPAARPASEGGSAGVAHSVRLCAQLPLGAPSCDPSDTAAVVGAMGTAG